MAKLTARRQSNPEIRKSNPYSIIDSINDNGFLEVSIEELCSTLAYLPEVEIEEVEETIEIIKDDAPIKPEEIEVILNSIINGFFSLDLYSASIDEIINTGSLNIIKDVKLREQISNWSFIVADTEDDIEIYYDYMFSFLIPSLSNKTNLRNMAIPDFLIEHVDIPQVTRSKFKSDPNKTFRTLQFENEVYLIVIWDDT